LAGAGTQNAGLAFGGYAGFSSLSCTEEYNGTSWSSGGALINGRSGEESVGTGIQSSALKIGGQFFDNDPAEEYDGTSWSTGGTMNVTRTGLGAAGTQNSTLAFGGCFSYYNCTEEYNGTSWTNGPTLIVGRRGIGGLGTQNEALAFGGFGPSSSSPFSCTEEYNGTSWSAGGALTNPVSFTAGAGTQNAGLAIGGRPSSPGPSSTSDVQEYNGSSWSAGSSLITGRREAASAGSNSSALAFGGYFSSSTGLSSTEELGESGISTKTFEYSSTTGETTVSCLIETSAERYKNNIQPMESQLSKVMQLQPVEFDWKTNKKHDIGFVADSVKDIYPNLVSTNEQGEVEGMNYSKLVSALVKSLQEQQEQLNLLSNEIKNLKNN